MPRVQTRKGGWRLFKKTLKKNIHNCLNYWSTAPDEKRQSECETRAKMYNYPGRIHKSLGSVVRTIDPHNKGPFTPYTHDLHKVKTDFY